MVTRQGDFMNYKMILAYDGTKYSGWQRNKNATDTIQNKLDVTLSKYFDEKVEVIGSGRTDKGVHARRLTANFHLTQEIDSSLAQMELNDYLPADIAILALEPIDDRFHSRFSAKGKLYSYTFVKGYLNIKPVFNRSYVAVLEAKVDVEKMRKASKELIGKHDFKGFSSDRTKKSTIRTLKSIDIVEDNETIKFNFVGDGFLYHMVRILTGTLIEIGTGTRSIESIEAIFKNQVRSEAGYLVPGEGLMLEEVYYE